MSVPVPLPPCSVDVALAPARSGWEWEQCAEAKEVQVLPIPLERLAVGLTPDFVKVYQYLVPIVVLSN